MYISLDREDLGEKICTLKIFPCLPWGRSVIGWRQYLSQRILNLFAPTVKSVYSFSHHSILIFHCIIEREYWFAYSLYTYMSISRDFWKLSRKLRCFFRKYMLNSDITSMEYLEFWVSNMYSIRSVVEFTFYYLSFHWWWDGASCFLLFSSYRALFYDITKFFWRKE